MPQGEFGPQSGARDLSRAGVTNKLEDLYLFRTPPLIRVEKAAPYGHNGTFSDLEFIVLHYVNPLDFFMENSSFMMVKDRFRVGRYLDVRSDRLRYIEIGSDDEFTALISF